MTALLSCSKGQPKCSADEQGFGDAPVVKLDRLATPVLKDGFACRARLDLIRTQADLASAFAELGADPPAAVDFTTKVVIARVDPSPATIVWAASKDGGIVLGLQGCDVPAEDCSAAFYTAPAPAAALDAHTCDPVSCGFTPNN